MNNILLTRPFRFARALRSRPFALLWTGQTISRIGDFAFNTALAWQVLLLTHSSTAMGLVLVASSLPQLVFLLIGGVAADRLPRRLVMLCSDTGRAVAVLLIALLGWLHLLQLWHLMGLALIFGIAQGFFLPSYQALPTQLVETEALASANSLNGLSRQAGTLLGPTLGAAFIVLTGPALAFAFDGLTFLVSTLSLLWMGSSLDAYASHPGETKQVESTIVRGPRSFLLALREGLEYVLRSPWLWVTILIASTGNVLLGGPIQIAFPRLINDAYHAHVWLLGLLGPATAAGSLLATFLLGQFGRLRRRGLLAYLSQLLASGGIMLLSLPLPTAYGTVAIVGGGFLDGIGLSVFGILWVTLIQEMVPVQKQGRVFSIDALGSFGLLPLGYTLVGWTTDALGPRLVFLGAGACYLLLNIVGLCVRSVREIN